MKTLKNVNCGETVVVLDICGEKSIKRKFMDMGITQGVPILVKKFAPLGDPMEIGLRGYSLIIRKEDADKIMIQ